jgi:hypothetical protein
LVIDNPLPEEEPDTPVGAAVQENVAPPGIELSAIANAVPLHMVVGPEYPAVGLGLTVTVIEIGELGQLLAFPETM